MAANDEVPLRRVAGLALVVFAAAAVLAVKAAVDLWPQRAVFPSWFVPLFVTGLGGLVLFLAAVTRGIWRARRYARPASGALGGVVWLLVVASFVATSSVHQLYPFRTLTAEDFLGLDPVLRFNLILTGVGFAAAAGLAVLYQGGRREGALTGLFGLDLLLLVPNDACANPFNAWWIAHLGASPLMFVPVLAASLFGAGALLGVHPRWNLLCLAAACGGVALLGAGHSTHLLW
ncbi:MAG TPA: hypothetical protein DD490_16070 [Acidobacteria bacterium]|nr:hypothetical protein [Acidobacteriota bacterium]